MKKLNNKILIIVFVFLVGIFVLVRIFRAPAQQSNLKKELVSLDTAAVTQIKLSPKTEMGEISFKRDGNKWTLTKFGKEYNLDLGSANNLLDQLVKLVPQRMVSRKKEKWDDYQVGDSSTRVQVLTGDDVVADLNIGRIGFNQSPAQMQQQQFGGGGFTYVRLTDEDEVYTVDGFLESSFNRSLNDFRNKSLIRLKTDEVTKITFNYPDSGFVAVKREKKWWIDDQLSDSTKMKSYLNTLNFKNATSFADDFVANRNSDLTLTIESSAGPMLTLKAWKRDLGWVFESSQQAGVYFSSEGSGIFQTVFERKQGFLPKR
jgi:Domain of unknown function (DUF4340)